MVNMKSYPFFSSLAASGGYAEFPYWSAPVDR